MINARELRIGNLVYSKTSIGYDPAGVIKVRQIKEDGINPWQDMGASGIGKCEDIEPIPLTVEWLTANDFVDTEDSYYRRCIQNEDTLSPTMLVISRGFAEIARSGIGAVAAPCKYVHQLMNLFFALTGEELTIKEKV